MKLTNVNGLVLSIPPDGLAVEEDPPGSTKITFVATGQVWNVQESVDQVLAMIAKEKSP